MPPKGSSRFYRRKTPWCYFCWRDQHVRKHAICTVAGYSSCNAHLSLVVQLVSGLGFHIKNADGQPVWWPGKEE